MMGFAEFIIGPAEGRTRWLYPSYKLCALVHRLSIQGGLSSTITAPSRGSYR